MCHNTTAQLEKRTICFIILTIVVAMKVVSVSITLCAVLTLSRALPLNSTLQTGSCDYAKQNCSSAPGAFCPRCDSHGNYLPLQCSGSSGYCWCVNVTSGQEIPNTQTPPGVTPACGLCKNEQRNCSKSVPGAFCPTCDANGNFLPEQCSGSTGYCWCVDVLSGKTLTNSKVPPGNQTTCGLCKNEQLNCSKSVPGAFCPTCDANGNFLPEQCSGSTGYCWCVDVFTGKVETNTTSPPGNRTIICVSGVVGNTSLLPEPKPGCVNCGNSSDGSEEENKSEESDSECDDCSDSSDSSEEENKSEESDSECDDCSDSSDSSEEEKKSEESDSECDDCSSESDACPTGWSRFRDQCYMFVNTPKTWIEAEIYCQFDEANLASVHCDKGNRFIMSLTRGDTHDFPQTWLGGFDAIRSGYWMWSDGSDFDYNNWSENLEDDRDEHKNHDDNGKKKKNCLRMNYEYDLKWFYSSCSETLPFVCAKGVSTPPDQPKSHNK